MFSIKYKCVLLLLCTLLTSAHVVKKDQSLDIDSKNISTLIEEKQQTDSINSTVIDNTHKSREGVSSVTIFSEGGDLLMSSAETKSESSSAKPFLQPHEGSEVSKSSIQARKGADINIPLVNNPPVQTIGDVKINSDNGTNSNPDSSIPVSSNKTEVTYKVIESVSTNSSTNSSTSTSTTTTKEPPHKPTLTMTFEEANPNSNLLLELKNGSQTFTRTDTSAKSAQNGIPNLNIIRNQPGFIIPIVITLFAVPLLGFIGYQAVKRGQEAWRNRHYRRMDFLIDGLYND